MIDFKNVKSLSINGKGVRTLSIDGRVVWKKTQASNWKGLKFKAETPGSTVYMYKNGSAPDVSLKYSTNGGNTWNDFTRCSSSTNLDGTIVTLENVGDSVLLKAGEGGNEITSSSSLNFNAFGMSGSVSASGNIMSLLDGDNFGNISSLSSNYTFSKLFIDCTSLTTPPMLPSTTLASNCYEYMFNGCTSLTEAPELPATTLAGYCYSHMFSNCTSLTQAPKLPANTLADYCYEYMFNGCTSLTEAPELHATTLDFGCYRGMLYGCTSLTQAPELPATTLEKYCYANMFDSCTSLKQAPILPATTLDWYCYSNMFTGCTQLTTPPELPATILDVNCYESMFVRCTSLTTAPELNATNLADGCYNSMFSGCSSLNNVRVKFTQWNTSYTYAWLSGVSSTGTFTCPTALADPDSRNISTIPNGWTIQKI